MLIDTATDDPAHIYAQAKMLLSLFETVPVAPKETGTDKKPLAFDVDAPKAAPAVPVAAATAIPAATGPVSSTGADALVDSAGVKWDHKLHTSTKTKDIAGKWKARKPREAPVPLPPPTVPAGTNTAPSPPPPPPPASMDAPPIPPPPTVLVPSSDDDIEVETDTGGVELVPAGAAQGIDFATFIARLTSGMNDGSITQVRVAEVQKQLDIAALFSLGDTEADKLQDAVKAFGFTL